LGYVILGYYLLHLDKKFSKILLFFVFISSSLSTFALSYIDSKSLGHFSGLFYNYLSPNVILSASSLFLLVKDFKIKQKYISKIIYFASKYSYGIYLSHVFVFSLMAKYDISINCGIIILDLIVQTVICFIISLAITYSISKLPFGKYISG
jgi:surface polysaccharide O-acyltransferase-like enzyme